MSSLYLHIPFCASKCAYCSFVSYPGMSYLYERYAQALKLEVAKSDVEGSFHLLDTVFFGGGTPTILAASTLEDILRCCQLRFGLAEKAEVSIEANPKTVDRAGLEILKKAGFNRISIGIQSFVDEELQRIGRAHSSDDGRKAVQMASEAGFSNVSLDLMYGLPGQSPASWQQSLEMALSLEPKHLSLYQLTVEDATPFGRQLEDGSLKLPEEDDVLAMDLLTAEFCRRAGLGQYEISNYAREGYECRHNINYWENGPYLGLGAGAVEYGQGVRRRKVADPLIYCELLESGESPIMEEECLDKEASFRESVIMGLRMNRGVSLALLEERYGFEPRQYYGQILARLLNEGFLELSGARLKLTSKGRIFANQVMSELV